MKYETKDCKDCGEKHNGCCDYCPRCIKDIKRKNVQETKLCYYCRCRKPIDEMSKKSHKYICDDCVFTHYLYINR